MSQALKARVLMLVAGMVAISAPALAHQSLAPHAHPHNENWLLGLDLNVIITLAAAGLLVIAVASCRWTVRGKLRQAETTTRGRQ